MRTCAQPERGSGVSYAFGPRFLVPSLDTSSIAKLFDSGSEHQSLSCASDGHYPVEP